VKVVVPLVLVLLLKLSLNCDDLNWRSSLCQSKRKERFGALFLWVKEWEW